ncbi:tetratricopeptide repeat protein [Candidatus Amarolinea dominans]|uniref:protein kinase domain-containing protein n=1 Tax=Candidatus Amarolinea dominans TaxID=3140696 RepID=UPI0031372698|nr:tetratricopeptide repeat protein [Anaerolineae bacterium]
MTTTTNFGKYQTIEHLGSGGARPEVYLALEPRLQRRVAIKVLLAHLAHDPEASARFAREARLVASLRHPAIVQLFDFDTQDDQFYMVMEYLEGGSLKERLAQRGVPCAPAEAVTLLRPVAAALDYAHAQGAVHRDIKPGNILFTRDGQAVISDFGVAKILGDNAQLSMAGSVVGTPAYMSPEQAGGGPVTPAADLYALGIVLYQMLTGQVPFSGDSPGGVLMQHLQTPPPAPRTLNPSLRPAVEAVLLQALAKAPAARFASASALLAALEAAQAEGTAPATEADFQESATLAEPPPSGPESNRPAAQLPGAALARPEPAAVAPVQIAAAPPPPAKPADVAGRLVKAADWVAPLVGRDIISYDPAHDRRQRLASLLVAISVLFAALQFVVEFFNFFTRPLAPLLAVWPYLVAPLVIAAGLLMFLAARRAPTPALRRRAAIGLAVITTLGLAYGAWTLVDRLQPPSRFIIAIAPFDGSQSSRQIDFARRIEQALATDLAAAAADVQIVRLREVVPDAATALARARDKKAALLIWGWYDDAGVSPQVEIADVPLFQHTTVALTPLLAAAAGASRQAVVAAPTVRDVTRFVHAPATIPAIDLFVKDGPQQMAYVSTALLGYVFYAQGDLPQALVFFDKALANAQASADFLVGRETIHFQRAAIHYRTRQVDAAVSDLEQALALQPDFYEAHVNLALAYSEQCTPAWQIEPALAQAARARACARGRVQPAAAGRVDLPGRRCRGRPAHCPKSGGLCSPTAQAQALLATIAGSAGQPDVAAAARRQALQLRQASVTTAADPIAAQVALGDAYLAAGDNAAALATFQAAAKQAPTNPNVLHGLGNAYYAGGQTEQTLAAYQAWAKAAPDDPDPRLLVGILYSQQQKFQDALTEMQAASRLTPCQEAAHLLMGQVYYQQQDLAQAATAYQAALAINPRRADAWYVLGALRWQLGDLPAAQTALQEATRRDPTLAAAFFTLGRVYFDQGAFADAAISYRQALTLEPDALTNYLALAHAYERLQQWDDAAATYAAALARQEDASTHLYLGLVRVQQGQLDAAVAEIKQALALNPHDALAHASLGDVYLQQGQLDVAADAYRQAIGEDDQAANNPSTHAALAFVEYKRCQVTSAVQAAEDAARLAPTVSFYQGVLASYYEAQGRQQSAADLYAGLQAAPATDAYAHLVAGDYAWRTGLTETAVSELQAVVAISNATPLFQSLAHAGLAQIAAANGRPAAAIDALSASLTAWPGNADAQARRGDLALTAGDAAAAATAYQQALALLADYRQQLGSDSAALLEVTILARLGLATRQPDAAASWFAQAQAAALALVEPAPQWPRGQLVLGYAALAAGDVAQAERAFTASRGCDASLQAAIARLSTELNAWRQ